MKTNFFLTCVCAGLFLPAVIRAQDTPAPEPRPGSDRANPGLREELRNLPPEERQARIREMRERFGQPDGGPVQRPFQGGPQAGMMAGRAGGAIERVFMVLTPEQRESIRKASEENREKVRDLEEKLRDARMGIVDAGIGKDFNEGALRKKLEAAAQLETELTLLRAKTLSKMEPPLSPEQIQRIKNPAPVGQRLGQPGEVGNRERPLRDENRPARPPAGPRDENDLPPRQ